MCTFIVDSKQTMHRFFWLFNLQMFFCSNEFGVWGFLLSVISEICCNFSQSTVKIPILIEYIPIMPCYPLSQYWVMMDKRSYHSNHYCGITYRREYLRPSRSHYRQSRKSWNRLLYRCLRPFTYRNQFLKFSLHVRPSKGNILFPKRHWIRSTFAGCGYVGELVVVMCLYWSGPVCIYSTLSSAVKVKDPH